MAEKREREEREKKKRERKRKVERGKVSFTCVYAWVGIFSGREGSSEGVQKRDVNGENFRLAGKS